MSEEGGQCGTIINGQGSDEEAPEESRVALPPGKLVLFDDSGSRVRVQSGVVSLPTATTGVRRDDYFSHPFFFLNSQKLPMTILDVCEVWVCEARV